eukprot:462229-Pyramimonas_sp.AAC.1
MSWGDSPSPPPALALSYTNLRKPNTSKPTPKLLIPELPKPPNPEIAKPQPARHNPELRNADGSCPPCVVLPLVALPSFAELLCCSSVLLCCPCCPPLHSLLCWALLYFPPLSSICSPIPSLLPRIAPR